MAEKNEPHQRDLEMENAWLRSELERAKEENLRNIEEWKDRAIGAEAQLRLIPRGERDCQVFAMHPKCPRCEERMKYYAGFRGRLVGKFFAGCEEEGLRDSILKQGEIDQVKDDLPDGVPPWKPDEE